MKTQILNWAAAAVLFSASAAFGQNTAYDAMILDDHPVSYWPLNETNGPTIHNVVGSNNGTCINPDGMTLGGEGVLADQGDKAIYFSGMGSGHIKVPYSSTLNPPQFTVEVWLHMPTFPVAGASANINPLTMDNAEPALGWAFDIQLANGTDPSMLGWMADNDWTSLNGGKVIQAEWSHYAMTYDGKTFSIYLNGALAASKASGYAQVGEDHPFYMGAYNEKGAGNRVDRFFRGGMEKVAFYSNALPASRILAHYKAGAPVNASLHDQLKALPFKIAYESYEDNNSDIFVMNADGSNPVNLTKTRDLNEHYPHVSPDGTRICFVADKGKGRAAIRSVYVMDIDGSNRKKVADYAREPFWAPDSKVIGYLDQEYPRFDVIDYYTKGMNFYDVATGKITPHPNYTNLHHLYNPNFSANGKWIVSTVHAGMGFDHTILLVEANGNKIVDLKIPGCRPSFSPDGKHLAWGADDNRIAAGPIDTDSDNPAVGDWWVRIKDMKNKIYHVRWSPDSKFLSFSRGPDGEGDRTKPGTFQSACEIMGVYATSWNIGVISAGQRETIDLNLDSGDNFVMLTTNGLSNKESAWFLPHTQ